MEQYSLLAENDSRASKHLSAGKLLLKRISHKYSTRYELETILVNLKQKLFSQS